MYNDLTSLPMFPVQMGLVRGHNSLLHGDSVVIRYLTAFTLYFDVQFALRDEMVQNCPVV